MLEDDPDRLGRFTEAVRSIDPALPLVTWRAARSARRPGPESV
jgi:hypothetical protein